MYPETVQRIIVYPADVVLYTVWAVVKWFMDPVTREKVQPMMLLSGVEQYIDRQYIPKSMVSGNTVLLWLAGLPVLCWVTFFLFLVGDVCSAVLGFPY
jgi:Na+/H+-translocating membrane pyrophosphatase